MGYWSEETLNASASTKTSNLLQGDILEFIGGDRPQVVSIYAVSSAGGVNLSVFADSDVIVDDKEIVNIGTSILRSDHLIERVVVLPGTHMFIFLREVDGTATTDILTAMETDPA